MLVEAKPIQTKTPKYKVWLGIIQKDIMKQKTQWHCDSFRQWGAEQRDQKCI